MIGFYLKAGGKYGNQGTAQFLSHLHLKRNYSGSGFATGRKFMDLGSTLECNFDREVISYTATVDSQNLQNVVDLLNSVVFRPKFYVHEIEEEKPTLQKLTLDKQSLSTRVSESLLSVAFRSGLGHSLYLDSESIPSFTGQTFYDYVSTHYTTDRLAVVGVGVDQSQLDSIVSASVTDSASPAPTIGDIFQASGNSDPLDFLKSAEAIEDLNTIMDPSEVARLQRMIQENPNEALNSFENPDLFNFLQHFTPQHWNIATSLAKKRVVKAKEISSTYFGGENFQISPSASQVGYAYGFSTQGANSNQAAALDVARKALEIQGVSQPGMQVTPFNYSFSDAGMFGLSSISSTSTGDWGNKQSPSSQTIEHLQNTLSDFEPSESLINDATNALLLENALINTENHRNTHAILDAKAKAKLGITPTLGSIESALKSVTVGSVRDIIQSVVATKPTIVARS